MILLALGCFALPQRAPAVSPPPDGGYPNFTTAEGQSALFSLTTGAANTAVGWFSLKSNAEGSFNTATGAGTLLLNTADNNTAFGAAALLFNTVGGDNTAVGAAALLNNTEGSFNTATGFQALTNTTGERNTADGADALLFNTDGNSNTAVGNNALRNTTGGRNTALGANAGDALTTGVNNIDIGNDVHGAAGESNTIRIGGQDIAITDTFIQGISGTTAAGGDAVFVTSGGHLGTLTSSARFKDEIKPMGTASEAILALRPVSFRYKKQIDPQGIPEFGLIAEEVAKVNPALITRDREGKPYTVRYEQINAMLLNEFLKEHKAVQEQGATIAELKKDFRATVAQLTARLEEQAAQIQKVSAHLEMNKPAPQMAANHP
jgi:hypothetical protein